MKHNFKGRSISVVNDFSKDEQLYLYRKTAELKKRYLSGEDCSEFCVNDPDLAIYLVFLENSTRTKESFRNAAEFHKCRLNIFDTAGSSFQKKESMSDTIKMLFGYCRRSLYIIRSTQEGVCRALSDTLEQYAEKTGKERASFINAGDGKHEHPTQEFLDEFSFLEQKNWDNSHIHIALTGDLFHGRTVHSKVDGLTIFDSVKVDLVAPEELGLPDYYIDRMKSNGFEVRLFPDIETYLEEDDIADIWYFTRLQLERMGDEILEKEQMLRKAVTFSERYMDKLKEGTRFYHPLPRHREFPVVPTFLDNTDLNGWDNQSINGFYTRVMEIALLAGKVGDDFSGTPYISHEIESDFIEEVEVVRKSHIKDRYKVGIKPVDNGIVIDHIGKGKDLEEIWNLVDKIRRIVKLNYRSSHGVFHTNDGVTFKGIISLPDIDEIDETKLKIMGAIAPGSTLNIIKDQSVFKKYRLHMPPRIFNFKEISCKNENCISAPGNNENVFNDFYKTENSLFSCKYCEKTYDYTDLWDI